jgi:GrpB-like predicted nucleotidyltransferase (UPF0157 family)
MIRKVEVIPHCSHWRNAFATESVSISRALGKNLVVIHHIGSTAIPQIYAKPIIDLLGEVQDLLALDQQSSVLESLGYEVLGEFGIPERRFFRKDDSAGIRTHHLHIFAIGSAQIDQHLAFRDYLIAHPTVAQKYSDLKRALATQYPQNIQGYMDGKDSFIREIDRQARQWRTL